MTRNELIYSLTPAIVRSTGKTASEVRANLEECTLSELGLMKDKQIRAGTYSPAQVQQPTAAELQAELDETRRLIQEDKKRYAEESLQRQMQADLDHEQFVMDVIEPKKRAEAERDLKSDRAAFAQAYTSRLFSNVEANFSVLRSVLGHGQLSMTTILQAIHTHQVQLAPPTAQELDEWADEDLNQLQPETSQRDIR